MVHVIIPCSATACVFIDITTDVNEHSSTRMLLFPVPAHDLLTVEVPEFSSKISFTILDLTGRIIFSSQLINGRNTFDVSAFSRGIYIARVSDNSILFSRKFIIV